MDISAVPATLDDVDGAERAELKARVDEALERLHDLEKILDEVAIALDDT